jgi:two-component system, sensor histidine kinase PdtaS
MNKRRTAGSSASKRGHSTSPGRGTRKKSPASKEPLKQLHELRARQAELERQVEELRRSLAAKDVLIREVHHRIKNNLQVVSSLMDLQSDTIQNEDARAALYESKIRVLFMARLHQQLCQSQDFTNVRLAGFLPDIAQFLCQSYGMKNVTVQNRMENIVLDIERVIPCGLIVNELVTNALKHSFRERTTGEVSVFMQRNGNEYELSVGNTGAQLPAGFDIENAKSMGLRLVQMLTRQLRGRLTFESGEKTVFKVSFPV